MQLAFKKTKENPATLLRRCGYEFQYESGGELVFRRKLGAGGYPRFHIYANVTNGDLIVNLHLDQKKHTYGESTRHHGEYENTQAVKDEAERIREIIEKNNGKSESRLQEFNP